MSESSLSAKLGCCDACNGTGTIAWEGPCSDCYGTGHPHPADPSCQLAAEPESDLSGAAPEPQTAEKTNG